MAFPQPEVTLISPNQSSRYGVKPSLIVLHITVSHNRPGVEDVRGMAEFMHRSSSAVSSHVVNDREGYDARVVGDDRKAWTQSAYNATALSIEQIHYDHRTTRHEWLHGNHRQLTNTARWIAYWSLRHRIPIRRAWTPGSGVVARSGVATHKQLGASGGGHVDPGTAYPMDYVLDYARWFKAREQRDAARRAKVAARLNPTRRSLGLKPLT